MNFKWPHPLLVPRARLELARQYDPSQDFKSCASTNFATGALQKLKSDFMLSFCQSFYVMKIVKERLVRSLALGRELVASQWLILGLVFAVSCAVNINLEDAIQGA